MSYNLRKDESYGEVLQKEGKDCFCPFQAPLAIPMQTAMGAMSMNIMRMPCCTLCPHVRIIEHIGKKTYEIVCSGEVKKIQVDEEKTHLSII